MDYAVGCELQYTTTQPTTLILNIEVQEANRQEVLREQFTVTPFVPSQVHAVPETTNRLRRMVLPVGKLFAAL